jgi:hypothetical protein
MQFTAEITFVFHVDSSSPLQFTKAKVLLQIICTWFSRRRSDLSDVMCSGDGLRRFITYGLWSEAGSENRAANEEISSATS